MATLLIAGGAGFVGSNLALQIKNKYPDFNVIALDNLKRRGSELNIPCLRAAKVEFIHGDIRNKEDLVFDNPPDFIIDAAAEPSVFAGLYDAPDYLINTNLNGTINLLNLATKHHSKFIFLSTSRIYPIVPLTQLPYTETPSRFELLGIALRGKEELHPGIAENFPLDGARSFYGATKLASELLLKEYEAFCRLQAVVNRCGVIAGPRQMGKVDQGVVTLWMAKHFWKDKLSYIGYGGSGKQVRDVMHILDLFDLIDYQINNFDTIAGKTYNVGGGREISFSLCELTQLCEEITGNKISIAHLPQTRAGDVPIYITDHRLVTYETGWQPKRNLHTILLDIYEWIKTNQTPLKEILAQ
jgi:CDP-paratose 2-epimerase